MFKILLVTAALCAISNGVEIRLPVPKLDGRIVGGRPTTIEEFPYQLSLQSYGSHICGASIISANWALTAAHCVHRASASSISFRAGSSVRGSGGSVHQAAEVVWHPQYSPSNIDYDYALVRVSTPFPVGKAGVKAVAVTTSEPKDGAVATVSGWGTTSSGGGSPTQLQQVQVPIIGRADCQNFYKNYDITSRMICAGYKEGGKDSCQGDSGGPLVVAGTQVGIVSWGLGCAAPKYPGVYTNIAAQRDWIKKTAGV